MVATGSGAERKIEDWKMSGFACYLVAMNADPSKAEVATAQTYFAVQTKRQERQEELSEVERRPVPARQGHASQQGTEQHGKRGWRARQVEAQFSA